jgi:ABC-type branched-subunit amino acid transport system substrate-binding protein
MKLGHRAGALLAASVLAAASGCSTKAPDTATAGSGGGGDGEVAVGRGIEGSTINLGVLTDLTGVFAALGADLTNAHTLFWEKQNAGDKVCGEYTVQLDTKDTGYVPAQGVQLFSGMQDEVLAMQQTIGSPINAALAEQYEANSVVNIPPAWARSVTELPGTATPGATYDVEMTNVIGYALEEGLIQEGDTIGHIYFEGEYGAGGLEGSQYMAEQHGLSIVEAKIKSTDQDMSAIITQMKGAGVKAIALTVAPTQLASAAGVAATQGLDVPLLGNNPVFAPGLLQGPAAEPLKKNLYVASPTTSLDAQPELLAEYQEKYPDITPSLGVVVGTGMSEIMLEILETACENGDMTPEGLVEAKQSITDFDSDGLLVPLDFSKVGESPSLQSYILQPADVPGGAKALTEQAYEAEDVAGLVGE